MAIGKNGTGMKKADLILIKVDRLARQVATIDARLASLANEGVMVDGMPMPQQTVVQAAPGVSEESLEKIYGDSEELKQDVQYLSAQSESVYTNLAKLIGDLTAEVESLKQTGIKVAAEEGEEGKTTVVAAPVVASAPEIDLDLLSSKVAEKIIVPRAYADVNYDLLAARVAERIANPVANTGAIDYELLAEKVAERMPAATAQASVDMDALAEKLAQAMPAQEVISPDYIASKVAEQIVVPESVGGVANIDVEELSRKVADKIAVPVPEVPAAVVDEDALANAIAEKLAEKEEVTEESVVDSAIDEQALAEALAERLNITISDEIIAEAIVKNLAGAIDSEEIADCVAKKVGTVAPEMFDVLVDDTGCDSVAKAIEEKINYDYVAMALAEKITPALVAIANGDSEIDTEELAKQISEKITLNANINEEAIADKAAAVLSNYLPEIDTYDIADKVVAAVIPALPANAEIDVDAVSSAIAEKLMEAEDNKDYDIVIDDEGLGKVSETVSTEIKNEYGERFDSVDGEIEAIKETTENIQNDVEDIKKMLIAGAVVGAAVGVASAVAEDEEEEVEEEVEEEPQPDPIEEPEEEEEPAEELVTVSEIVEEEPEKELEEAGDEEEDDVIEEIVDDIDESLSDGEIMPDGLDEMPGGVDFASMMKYNRSFIARIIQSTDDVKQYYGEVKTALLSYKKVNSNIAWGAERFNKGRETIARFKIRGKTLCLYLALNPEDYKISVYHHIDASDNKSMHGTPMMVKIKSPLGAKKAIRLIDEMLEQRGGVKHNVVERDYAAMYPFESIEELIEDGLVKDVNKDR